MSLYLEIMNLNFINDIKFNTKSNSNRYIIINKFGLTNSYMKVTNLNFIKSIKFTIMNLMFSLLWLII